MQFSLTIIRNAKKTDNMLDNISFIGGIHGVGKSTICRQICDELKLEYLSASELLKWREVNDDFKNKKVKSIPATQDRLIISLRNIIQKDKCYLLDGHYCLLNNKNDVINIPLETFKKINPISLNLIIGDIAEIKNRLEKRDNRPYNYKLLERMQNSELSYAKHLSKTLGVTLSIGTQNNFSEILTSLHKAFSIK